MLGLLVGRMLPDVQAPPLDYHDRLPRLEAVIEDEARDLRTMRRSFGAASLIVSGALVPLGIWSAKNIEGGGVLGTTMAIGAGAIGVIGLGAMLIPTALEDVHAEVARRRRIGVPASEIVRYAERRWRELAAREESARGLSWVTYGGGAVLIALGSYLAVAFENRGGVVFAAIGGVYMLWGAYNTSVPGHYRRGLRIYERAMGVAVGPIPGGAIGGLSFAF